MPKEQNDLLNRINVRNACSADWDSMTGNEQMRFCQHCNLSVNNLSTMTREQIMRLVERSRGRLCVRYYRRPDGAIQTTTISGQLHQITRRASRIAAGAFSAVLSLSASVAAQTPVASNYATAKAVELAMLREGTRPASPRLQNAGLTGIVTDPTGACVPGASVTLANMQTGQQQTTTSNDEGEFRFMGLEAGVYTLRVEQPGFMPAEVINIVLRENDEQLVNVSLEVGQLMMGDVAVIEPNDPLVRAAWEDNLAALKELLADGASVNAVDRIYGTALAQAVARGDEEMVDVLLWAGADANAGNESGRTPLMFLTGSSTPDVVKALISAGAKLDLKDENGNTALTLAAEGSSMTNIVQALIDAGATVNEKNQMGRTALMIAAKEGGLANVKALIKAGADVNERDVDGETALKLARDNDQTSVMNVLISYGAVEYLMLEDKDEDEQQQ